MQRKVKRLFSAGALTATLGVAAVGGGIVSTETANAAVPQGTPASRATERSRDVARPTRAARRGSEALPAAVQNLWWAAYNAAFCGNTTTADVSGSDMGTYDYTLPTWDDEGLVAANCRTDAYAGTDIPYTTSQLVSGLDGPPGNGQSTPSIGCPSLEIPALSQFNFAPDAMTNPTGVWPNPGGAVVNGTTVPADAQAKVMSFPVAGFAVAIEVNLTSADCGGNPTGPLAFTPQQLSDLMGGNLLNWNTAELRSNGANAWLANCNEPVTRVVPSTPPASPRASRTICSLSTPSVWARPPSRLRSEPVVELRLPGTREQRHLAQLGPRKRPGAVRRRRRAVRQRLQRVRVSGGSGDPALLRVAGQPTGGHRLRRPRGRRQRRDAAGRHNPRPSRARPGEPAERHGRGVSVAVGGEAGANCDFTALSVPEGGAATGMVSLDIGGGGVPPDTWADDNAPDHVNATDIGAQYPICGLMFDLVYSGLSSPFGTASAISDLSRRPAADAVLVPAVHPLVDRPERAAAGRLRRAADDVDAGDRQRLRSELLDDSASRHPGEELARAAPSPEARPARRPAAAIGAPARISASNRALRSLAVSPLCSPPPEGRKKRNRTAGRVGDRAMSDRPDDRAAHDLRRRHRLGEATESAAGAQLAAEAARALQEDADTRSPAQLGDRAIERSHVSTAAVDGDLPHPVEDPVQPVQLPHRGLGQGTDLTPVQRGDPDRTGSRWLSWLPARSTGPVSGRQSSPDVSSRLQRRRIGEHALIAAR